MRISKKRRGLYWYIASRGGKELPPLFSRFCLALPVLSGSGRDGPQTYFKRWRVYYVELVKTTPKKATFYVLGTVEEDPRGPVKGYPIIEKAIENNLLVSPHSFILFIPASSPAVSAEREQRIERR